MGQVMFMIGNISLHGQISGERLRFLGSPQLNDFQILIPHSYRNEAFVPINMLKACCLFFCMGSPLKIHARPLSSIRIWYGHQGGTLTIFLVSCKAYGLVYFKRKDAHCKLPVCRQKPGRRRRKTLRLGRTDPGKMSWNPFKARPKKQIVPKTEFYC